MTHTTRLKKHPHTFRRLTGITPEKFDEIWKQLKPRYDEWNEKRRTRPGRKRKVGGGRLFHLEPEDKFLMLLFYYRTYTTHVLLGLLFGIDDSNVGRNMNPLEPLLAGIFRIPEKKIDLTEDEIIELFFDGTEQPIHKPKKGQRKWYSGKKKKHTIKHQVVVVKKKKKKGRGKKKQKLRIASVSKAFTGKTHDKKVYEETKTISPPRAKRIGDTAYLGTMVCIPKKKPQGKPLAPRWKKGNKNHASKRVVVEHGIGKMKNWRICSERYRNKRSKHTLMFKNIAGFHNMMYA
jgi:hypothetical protein